MLLSTSNFGVTTVPKSGIIGSIYRIEMISDLALYKELNYIIIFGF